jgi:hypothetical protein
MKTGELQSRGPVHFSAQTLRFLRKALSENMDLTPLRRTLQFSWGWKQQAEYVIKMRMKAEG